MSGVRRMIVGCSFLLLGLALVPYLGLGAGNVGWQRYANVYQPLLTINHPDGSPGSYFSLSGSNYPPASPATISINGQLVASLRTDSAGRISFTLQTSPEGEIGAYFVTVEVNPQATAGFKLSNAAPLRPREDQSQAQPIAVPPDIAFTNSVYIPLTRGP